MWKLLNALYHVASYVLFLVVLLGASCKLLNIFLFHDFIPFTVELLLVVFSLILLKNYRPYDFLHWTKEK